MTSELEDLKTLRDQLRETIRHSADRMAAGKPEVFLSERDKAERARMLASMEAAIRKLEGH